MSISDAELRAAIHRVNDVAHDNVPCQPISKLCLPYLRELLAARCLAESLLQLFRNSGPITQCPFCLESGDMLNYDPEYRKPNPDEHSKDCPLLAAQTYLATYGKPKNTKLLADPNPGARVEAELLSLRHVTAELLEAQREGGSLDGCDIQELLVKHGILEPFTATEPCCENGCVCAEVSEFPLECYRRTEIGDRVVRALDKREEPDAKAD